MRLADRISASATMKRQPTQTGNRNTGFGGTAKIFHALRHSYFCSGVRLHRHDVGGCMWLRTNGLSLAGTSAIAPPPRWFKGLVELQGPPRFPRGFFVFPCPGAVLLANAGPTFPRLLVAPRRTLTISSGATTALTSLGRCQPVSGFCEAPPLESG